MSAFKETSKGKDTRYDRDEVDACLKLFKEREFRFEG
jgi:hypothetical protein